MTEYTRPATWEDVKTLARYLDEAGAEYALVGAYAIAAHGFSRFSEDIDILVNPTAENSRRWILALSRLPDRAAAELAAEGDVFADDKRYAIRINDEFTVDVMPSVAGFSWAEMAPHIVSMTIDGTSIRVLDLPGLLKTKQRAPQGSDGRRRHCRGAASARQTLGRTRKVPEACSDAGA